MAAPADFVRTRPGPPPRRQPSQRRGRRPRWLTILLNSLIVLVALGVAFSGLSYVYIRHQLGKIKKVDIPALKDDSPGSVMNVLLVGSDSRANTTGYLAEEAGKATEGDRQGLSDTMMILHVDPHQGSAAILSIPRDLWVTLSNGQGKDRINAAFAIGGPQLLISTIQDNLGIAINHYVEVDLEGFKNIVDTVGGLKIYVDAPAKDDNSGLDLPEAGCVQLDGYQALAYVRSRYYESYEAGRWVYDETSDFGRIKRQQDFIRRMMRKAVSSGLSNPLTLNRLISIGVNNLTIDSGMSTKDIVSVARKFKSLDPDSVDMQTLPTERYITPGGADVQLLVQKDAQPLIDRINGLAPAQAQPVRPTDVQVRVLNGNGADGAASSNASALQKAGFQVIGSGDADAFTYTTSVIRYAPGQEAKANLLKSYLYSGATLTQDSTLGTADVALVVGSDFTGVRASPVATAPSPTTTAPAPNPAPDAKGAAKPAC